MTGFYIQLQSFSTLNHKQGFLVFSLYFSRYRSSKKTCQFILRFIFLNITNIYFIESRSFVTKYQPSDKIVQQLMPLSIVVQLFIVVINITKLSFNQFDHSLCYFNFLLLGYIFHWTKLFKPVYLKLYISITINNWLQKRKLLSYTQKNLMNLMKGQRSLV